MRDRGVILIADDDSLLCRTIAAALRRNGLRTVMTSVEEMFTTASRESSKTSTTGVRRTTR